MIRKEEECRCPKCGDHAYFVMCFPTEHYDPPPEVFIDCPECGAFDEEDLEDEV